MFEFIDASRKDEGVIVPSNASDYFEYYVIKKGDNLYNISKKYNINPELLTSLNGLDDSDYIYPNEVLLIPKSNYSYYITKSGDTLDGVIRLLGGDKNKFLNENNIIYLQEGQLLVSKAK